MSEFDVAIVGYGPTGKMLARLLAGEGHRVAVVERWKSTYPLPRAIAYFHDAKRMFHAIGLMRDVRHISRPLGHYVWYSQDWEPLVDVDFGIDSPSGGPEGYTFSQPDLENLFDTHLSKFAGITFFKGYDVLKVGQSPEAAQVTIAPFDQERAKPGLDDQRVLTARYVVGCDGANSVVRQAMGAGQIDLGFDARWLVVDIKPHDMSAHGDIPDLAQWCNPTRPTTIVPCGIDKRRWEFMMAPDETVENFTTDENVWRMIAQWITPDQATIVRKAVYNFRSLIADKWRDGRLLLAGDAAHLMPPFMGQGLGSGLRDAWTLGWEMDLVLKGLASDRLLDGYEQERSDHVRNYIELSMAMGRVVCILDKATARARDTAMKAGNLPPPPIPPRLTGGALTMADGAPAEGAGLPLPHTMLHTPFGEPERLDDVTGRRFVLVTRNGAEAALNAADRDFLDRIGAQTISLGGAYRDETGRLDAFLDAQGAVALIARPDFHSFGTARTAADLPALVDALRKSLTGAV